MSKNTGQWFVRALAICFAAAPVGFGALRALTTGTDFRYLFTALAVLAAAGITFRVGAARVRSRWLLSFLALALSTLVGGVVAVAQGATSIGAIAAVVVAFGLCVTIGGMLGVFSRTAV
jgi:hypothetical protein